MKSDFGEAIGTDMFGKRVLVGIIVLAYADRLESFFEIIYINPKCIRFIHMILHLLFYSIPPFFRSAGPLS